MPKTWKQGLFVKIPQQGDLTECENLKGITLTSVPSKVFGRVLIDRIRDGVNSKLRDEQAGLRSGRGTVEHIFILRNIIEQVAELQAYTSRLYTLKKRLTLCTERDYGKSWRTIEYEGEESEWLKVKTGVKQADVKSGFNFLMIMRNTTAGNKTWMR